MPVPRAGGRKRPKLTAGKMSPRRRMWVELPWLTLVFYNGPTDETEHEAGEPGDPCSVSFKHQGSPKQFFLSLTSLREDELMAFKEFMDRAIETALPVVRQRDAHAAKALEQGDDSYNRIYRAVPRLHVRKQLQSQHDQGVPLGSEGDDGGTGD